MKIHLLLLCVFAALSTGLYAQTPAATTEPIRVACVGDSITIGAGSTNPYPKQLQGLLGAGYDVKNFGVSGRTLLKKGDHPYWTEKFYADALAFKPNVVVIMLGTNDTKPQNWKFEDEFAADYKALIESFKNLDSKPTVYLCRPPPVFGNGNYHINETNLKVLIPIIDQVAQDEGATVLDMHAALHDHPETETDFVHPNAKGDGIMAQVVADALTKAKTP